MAAHGGGFRRVQHNISKVPDTPAAPEYNKRAASNIAAELAEPWPLVNFGLGPKPGPKRDVVYCLRDEAVRNENRCEFEQAIARWYEKLGYTRGNQASNLRFLEWKRKEGRNMVLVLCRDGNMQWNRLQRMPTYALEICFDRNVDGIVTTIGYEPNGKAGRHSMRIGEVDSRKKIGMLTHELGHAIGRLYVKFDCTNLYGYEEALEKAKIQNPNQDVASLKIRLCEDIDFAYDLGFIGYEFIRFPDDESHDEPNTLFDYDSVMMYDSTKGADNAEEYEFYMNYCPLLKWQTAPIGTPLYNLPMERIYAKKFPSDGDAKFVHKVYATNL
ncbi:hypothetical protein G6514_007139 [Epicoccum nigrum]|nr:hypothetical protein G6514_007139 [Epicoccum nigrum]